jgi:hypothetical protein
MEQFVANFGPWLGVVAFAALARLTPTKSDDKIVEYVQTIFGVLGLQFPDNKGKEEEK